MVNLNIQVQNVRVEQPAPINVFYKVFAPNHTGRMVPTLIRNNGKEKAKDIFVALLEKSKALILNITAQIDLKWEHIPPHTVLTFTEGSQDEIKEQVSEIIRQVMSQIAKDEHRDLYDRISLDLIVKNEDAGILQEIKEDDDDLFPL